MSSRSVASTAAARTLLHLHVEGVHLRPVQPNRAHAVGDFQPNELPGSSPVEISHRVDSLPVGCGCGGPQVVRSDKFGTPSGIVPSSGTMARVTPGMWEPSGPDGEGLAGTELPLGATWSAESTNFAVYAPAATQARVCLFDDDVETAHQLTERSLGIWHGAIPGVAPGTRYGYRVDGPWSPAEGPRFNRTSRCSTPTAAVSGRPDAGPGRVRLPAACPRRDERGGLGAVRPPQRRRRRPLRLGRRRPHAPALARHGDLRDARQGHDRPPRPGARGACAARTPVSRRRR